MNCNLPSLSGYDQELTVRLEQLHLEFLDLYTRHKDMVENESIILTSLYLEKLGHLQLESLKKQTEAARLNMKMKLIQAAINRDEKPDLFQIENLLNSRMKDYYAQIEAQSAALDDAKNCLSHLIPEDEAKKLKELFRVLCKRLHPDLHPNQKEEEKDLFVKVKAAYELNRLTDLQNILLFLDESNNDDLLYLSPDSKKNRIEHLEKNIELLKGKLSQMDKTFPFNIKEFIFDEKYIVDKQKEIKSKIESFEEEISGYINIINLMIDE